MNTNEKIKQLTLQLDQVRHELALLNAELRKTGTWKQLNGTLLSIVEVEDAHLVNALKVCERRDPRYDWSAERMRAFADLVKEAARRGLEWR